MSTSNTAIEWTDRTWNPVRGCSLVSPGCTNCYAMRHAHRFAGRGKPYEGLTRARKSLGPVWTGDIRLVREALDEPLRWRSPARVFVNSMSDLFHENVPDGFITDVWRVMFSAPLHTFQILTKRPERARDWLAKWIDTAEDNYEPKLARGPAAVRAAHTSGRAHLFADMIEGWGEPPPGAAYPSYDWMDGMIRWPRVLPNVWLGVSVENRAHGLPRLEVLRELPVRLRFLSVEPLLEDLGDLDLRGIGWVIVGGESGPDARPCDVAWIRRLIAQCREQRVPVFVKQLGAVVRAEPRDLVGRAVELIERGYESRWELLLADAKGGDMNEWPEDLRVREMPEVDRG